MRQENMTMNEIGIGPLEHGLVEVELSPGEWRQFKVLMWKSGTMMSTVEDGHVRYFARDDRYGKGAWAHGGRPVAIREVRG